MVEGRMGGICIHLIYRGSIFAYMLDSNQGGVLNLSIPQFKCYVKRSWFTKDDSLEWDKCYAFGIQSVAGKILTFHVMTDYGMLRSRVPISEIYWNPVEPEDDIPSDFKQLWDCFSENVAVVEYDYLAEKRCQVITKDKTMVWATYLFTVDWYRNPYSDEPTDYKCGHVLVSDEGYLLCMPNNRIYWKDSNWVTKPFPINPKEFKVDDTLESVETKSDRWVSEDSSSYYYEYKEISPTSQGEAL